HPASIPGMADRCPGAVGGRPERSAARRRFTRTDASTSRADSVARAAALASWISGDMLRAEGTEALRADISDGRHLRDRPVGFVVGAATVVWLAFATAAPTLAAGNAPGRASTSLYKLSLKISS